MFMRLFDSQREKKDMKAQMYKSWMMMLIIVMVGALVLSACAATGAGDTPTEEGEVPTEEGEVPTEEGEVPTQEDEPQLQKLESAGDTRWGYGCLGTAEGAIEDLDCREITIAIENAYLPFNYVDPASGMADGWDYHAWREICIRLHCAPVFVETGWEGMIQAVADGQFDAAADGISITEERAGIVDFSEGYINIDQRLLVRVDEDRFA